MAIPLGAIVGATARGALVKVGTSKMMGANKNPSAIIKAEPQSKSGALVVRNTKVNVGRVFPTSGEPSAPPGAITKSSRGGMSLLDDVIVIKTKVIQIEKLIQNKTLLDKSREETKRKGQRKENFEKREEKLETPKKASAGAKKAQMDVPKLGLFGVIKRWLFWTFVGWLFNKYGDQLPKLIPVVKMLGNVAEGIFNFAGNLLKGVVDFIDFGYKAYDNVRNIAKTIGGENLQQTFDSFSKNFNTFLNLALIAGMATMGGGGFGKGGKASKPGAVAGGASRGAAGRPRITTSGGGPAGRPDIRNPLRQRPQVTTGMGGKAAKGFGGKAVRILGKGLGKIPIIGGLIDLVINLAMGEPLGRAAAKAVGSTIGAALGTFIPVPFAGTILGGILGDIVGGAVYDTLVKPKDKNKKMAAGGKVAIQQGKQRGPIRRKTTRSGKAVGSSVTRGGRKTTTTAARAVTVAPTTRTPILKQIGLKVGSAVGGLFNLFGLFPNPKKDPDKKVVDANKEPNPMGFLEESHKASSRTPFFGSLFSVLTKTILGDRATKLDYKSVAQGLVGLFNQAFADGILRGPASAFASGGVIDMVNAGDSADFSSWLEKTVESSITPKMNDVRQDLMRQLMLEKEEGKGGVEDPKDTPGKNDPSLDIQPGVTVTGGNADFWTLVAIASREDGDPQGWADVAQSIYNRVASGVYGAKTIKGIITREGQYEPTWKYPRFGRKGKPNSEWINIVDAQTASKATGMSVAAMNSVAAALRNKKYQDEAAKFIGGRTDFMGGGNQPGPGDIRRTTNSPNNFFGWFVGPAAIAYGRKNPGPARVPNLGNIVVMGGDSGGGVLGGSGKFIQGNSGASRGIHFHIGPGSTPGQVNTAYNADARASAAKVIDHFLSKGVSLYDGRRGTFFRSSGEVGAAQRAHSASGSQGGIDIQAGGAYDPGATKPFPLKVSNMAYRRGGFGVSAKIDGSNSFVAHGRYDQSGKLAPQESMKLYFRGGSTKKGGPIMTHPGEFVIDKDSVDLFGLDFIRKINNIENRSDFLTKSYDLINNLQKLITSANDVGGSSMKGDEDDKKIEAPKMQGGGYIGKTKPSMNLSPLQAQASYEAQGTMMAIQPVIVEKVVQSQGSAGSKIMFGGSGVNSDSNLAAHMRGS